MNEEPSTSGGIKRSIPQELLDEDDVIAERRQRVTGDINLSIPQELQDGVDVIAAKLPGIRDHIKRSIPRDHQDDVDVIAQHSQQKRETAKLSDLDDNQKRWSIVGICLHRIISPALRKFVLPILTALYNELTLNHKIDTQTYQTHLQKYPPRNVYLNYEAVNNNKATFGYQKANYDYTIKSVVDLSKLFLQTHMAQYTGFDDTCHSSALLRLIINIDKFPTVVKSDAEYVRSVIKDPWAHCIITDWTAGKYSDSFQRMEQLVKNLSLSFYEENQIIETLKEWKINAKPSDLDDNEQRWLFVGICMNTVLIPALRKYVVPILTVLYNELIRYQKIDTQTYLTHLKCYPPTNTFLNYEAVNNNKATYGHQKANYDYTIKSVVDVSKLFLPIHMAPVKSDAEDVRRNIRNKWAKGDCTQWDAFHYSNSFQLMGKLVKDLSLSLNEENQIIGKMKKWKINELLPDNNVKMTTSKDELATVRDEIEIQGHTGGKHEDPDLLPFAGTSEDFQKLLSTGTYESFENRVFLCGSCACGKSTLASVLIGSPIPLTWKSTDGLVIHFGRNGINLESFEMVPLKEGKVV
ncbi:unnamed protein product [Mytilus coruscus]|uniref:DZIP3-like HEPN domain-containing protein n=1 Tax=Mytilus coruscus TaxID=42192 RepID=A0A6J8DAJ2_MYTCO|nr:unnamed protein product [Mytilus coruscus]